MSSYFFQSGKNFDVGRRIKEIRGNLGQKEFGEILGVKPPAISKYESGRIPDAATLKRIADYGGVTIDWILHGGQPEKPEDQASYCIRTREHAPEIYDARPVAPLDLVVLIEVEAVVDAYYRTHKLKRSPIQRGRLVGLVYEHCTTNNEHPDELLIKRYLPLAD